MMIRSLMVAGCLLGLTFMPFAALAVEETPMSIPGGTFVTAEKAKEQFDKGADAAIKAGCKQVYWFRDGLPAWSANGYPTE